MKKWLYYGAYLTFLGFILYGTSSFSFLYKLGSTPQPQKQILGWENYIAQSSCNVTPYPCGGAMYFDTNACVCKCSYYPTCSSDQVWDPYYCICRLSDSTMNCLTPHTCPTGTEWSTSTCSCNAVATCPTPQGGCGSGYFNSASCSCQYPTSTPAENGYCFTPHTCSSGMQWSTSSCSCITAASGCTYPPLGCGGTGYFDYTGCTCVYPTGAVTEGNCLTPQPCQTGYYWSSSSCGCLYSGTTSSGGSGSNCITPLPCSDNYVWNSSTCACVYAGSSCTTPTGGCGNNYYWDNVLCMCKPLSTSCVPPTSGCGNNYSWNSSTCTCVYAGSLCTAPSYGCGVGYFWDSLSCACKPSTSSCSPPTFGCSSGYYWDYSACTCKPSTTYCTAPSAGCGSGYYWDSGSCMCKTSSGTTYCTVPSAGCGSGYYWDSALCVCKAGSSSYTYCSSPMSGCGTYYYWDSGTCSCKPSASTCYPPSAGCGNNYFWDSPSCSCRPLGVMTSFCTAPSSGCGLNSYWDSVSCSCKQYSSLTSSCYPPSYGCGINYFWDSYACSCRPANFCYAPVNGCGTNYYWDGNTCSCKYSSPVPTGATNTNISCYPPSTSCGTGYYWDSLKCACNYSQVYFDRLAYENSETIGCIDKLLNDPEYQTLKNLIPQTQEEKDFLAAISDKVKSCYQKTLAPTGQVVSQVSQLSSPLGNESCLISLIGEKAYREIYSGVRPASYTEKFAFQKCYQDKVSYLPVYISESENLTDETSSCLKSVLGAKLFDAVKKGEEYVPYELKSEVDKCFGSKTKPFASVVSGYKAPEVVLTCLERSLGKDTYQDIKEGRRQPTDVEKSKASPCFEEVNTIQAKFVPPPVEQIPYLEENTETIAVANARQETVKKRNKIVDNKITLKGKGLKNSTVTIFVFSEPIVVTTKTDENGDWVYELKDPVTGGKHIAYATVKTKEGDVRSSVFNFEVTAAEPDLNDLFVEETKSTPTVSKFMIFSLSIVGVGLVLLLGGIFIMRRTKENQHNFLSTFKRLFTGYRVNG